MADKEHRAAKAGRYVRAAGIVLGKEIDRRAAAAAARPAPVAPPPPPPPPAPARTGGMVGNAVFGLFVLGIVAGGLTILHFPDVVPSSARTGARLVLAFVLAAEAYLLISNRAGGNARVGQRLLTRMWGARGPMNRRERSVARFVRDALILIGIAFLGAAVYQVLIAFVGT